MALRITFLGTGGAFTDFRVNYHNNALVHTGVGPVLIDCGGTAPQALRELGLCALDAVAVCITHLHGDHVGGLEQLVWERLYAGATGPTWSPTPVIAAPTVLEEVRQSVSPLIGWNTHRNLAVREDGWEQNVRPRAVLPGAGDASDEADVFEIGGVRFSLHWTPHVSDGGNGGKHCTGVRVRAEDGAELYFTSDTEFRGDIGARFPDAVIFHDTTFIPHHPGTVHTHYSQLLTLPEAVRKRVVLMHHTQVPPGCDPAGDGFAHAADRYDTFEVTSGGQVSRVSDGPSAIPLA